MFHFGACGISVDDVMAFFDNRTGNETFRGTEDEYDQVDYSGALSDYTFTVNSNGSVTVSHPTLGTDTLWEIDGFWFGGEERWYSLEDALILSAGDNGYIDANGVITGNDNDNTLTGDDGDNLFYGGLGDDIINGNGGGYNQVEADGDMREWTFTENADGTVTMSHPTWGTDTLSDIDGFWFMREQAWYSIDDAIALTANLPRFRVDADDVLNGTAGNDTLRANAEVNLLYGGLGNDRYIGRANDYDQINLDGFVSEYSFTVLKNGNVQISHDRWGVDTLVNIDGIWFAGEGAWYSVDDAITASDIQVNREVYDGSSGNGTQTNSSQGQSGPAPLPVLPAPDFDPQPDDITILLETHGRDVIFPDDMSIGADWGEFIFDPAAELI